MSNNKTKHLEFIQATISRMNTNSFLLKGWSTTILIALVVFSLKESDADYMAIVYTPTLIFWFLDGYFLSQERRYRELFESVRIKDEDTIDFSMKTKEFEQRKNHWISSTFSITLILFYGVLIILSCLSILFIKNI